jgi:hypothetical protein
MIETRVHFNSAEIVIIIIIIIIIITYNFKYMH